MTFSTQLARFTLAFGCIGLFSCHDSSTAQAQTKEAASKASEVAQSETFSPGIAIGTPVPEISLKDQHGDPVSLSEIYAKQPVALVLYRSADW